MTNFQGNHTDLFPTVGVTWSSGLGMSMVTGSEVWFPARRCRRKSQFSSHESASTTMSPGLTSQHSLSEQESGGKKKKNQTPGEALKLCEVSMFVNMSALVNRMSNDKKAISTIHEGLSSKHHSFHILL